MTEKFQNTLRICRETLLDNPFKMLITIEGISKVNETNEVPVTFDGRTLEKSKQKPSTMMQQNQMKFAT